MTDPSPAQRVRAELAVAMEKLKTLRAEWDAAILTGHIDREQALDLGRRMGVLEASIWRIKLELRKMAA